MLPGHSNMVSLTDWIKPIEQNGFANNILSIVASHYASTNICPLQNLRTVIKCRNSKCPATSQAKFAARPYSAWAGSSLGGRLPAAASPYSVPDTDSWALPAVIAYLGKLIVDGVFRLGFSVWSDEQFFGTLGYLGLKRCRC